MTKKTRKLDGTLKVKAAFQILKASVDGELPNDSKGRKKLKSALNLMEHIRGDGHDLKSKTSSISIDAGGIVDMTEGKESLTKDEIEEVKELAASIYFAINDLWDDIEKRLTE